MMRIGEVRNLLKKYSKEQLELIIAEMYKAIPKAVKEGMDIDGMLSDPDALKGKKKRTKAAERPDIVSLETETEEFIGNAYNQYYFAPNSVVPKRERPKWRFVAKRLYKSLLAAARDEDNIPAASRLLEKLYVMLCYSCSYILFSAYDSFESVGIAQSEFFHSVLTLKRKHEAVTEFVPHAVSLIVDNGLNRYTLATELMEVALEFFSTPDIRELAVKECDNRVSAEVSALVKAQKGSRDRYEGKKVINDLVEIVFLCCRDLHEVDRGIRYCAEKYQEDHPEIKLYVILRWLYRCDERELFVREYKKALEAGVKPRKQLVDAFTALQKTGEFPKYF